MSFIAEFDTTIMHNQNSRMFAIPSDIQSQLGLARKRSNDWVCYKLRPIAGGKWTTLYGRLTYDCELSLSKAITGFNQGDSIKVRIIELAIPKDQIPKYSEVLDLIERAYKKLEKRS